MDYENKVHDGSLKLEDFNKTIEFKNVGFKYDSSDTVLENISFKINKGNKIGICGPSGGGKTTLIKLIPRFYDATEGEILIDGISTKEFTLDSLRKKIGIVSQDMYIFNDTILNNILYASPNSDMNEVIKACKRASIYDFIKSLPEKFDTVVGENGMKLSGGQKQRLGLARVFLANPEIVILDEATSSLDNESEKIIKDAMKEFKNNTVIAIAHRLSTIKNSDMIYVIDDHKIKEKGKHKELMEIPNGIYKHLYELMLSESEE